MKTVLMALGFGLLCLGPATGAAVVSSEKPAKTAAKPLKADTTLIAIPIRARSIMAGGTINALERPAAEMPPAWTAVVFHVERVLDGDFKIPKKEEISLWSQMKDAADDKNVLKLLLMDFDKPEEGGMDRGWLSMAVIDSYASFGIREGEVPAKRQRYRLSLARAHKDPDSYILVESKKI